MEIDLLDDLDLIDSDLIEGESNIHSRGPNKIRIRRNPFEDSDSTVSIRTNTYFLFFAPIFTTLFLFNSIHYSNCFHFLCKKLAIYTSNLIAGKLTATD